MECFCFVLFFYSQSSVKPNRNISFPSVPAWSELKLVKQLSLDLV